LAEARQADAVAALRLAERGQVEADTQRRSAQAVVDFLTHDVLTKASPDNTRDGSVRDMLVKALIEPALQTVGRRFGDQPLVRASVQETLAITLLELGRFDLGIVQARAAWQQRQRELGDDHPDTIAALDIYAQSLEALGRGAEAVPLLRRAWEQDRHVLGDDHPNTIGMLDHYASLLAHLGRYAEAEPLARQTWAWRRRVPGQVLVRVAATSINPIDNLRRSGMVKDIFPITFPGIIGVDLAGTVIQPGPGVEGFAAGDRVIAMAEQTYAELCVVPASILVKLPEGLDLVEAAALPLVTTTGAQLIAEGTGIQAGQTVLGGKAGRTSTG
jgi:hypothetical protein